MEKFMQKLAGKIDTWRAEIKEFKTHADTKVCDVSVGQMLGGMRGVYSLVCDTSLVPPDQGLIIRGHMLKDLVDKSPVEIFYLLLTGELPNEEEFNEFSTGIKVRKPVPHYVWDVLKAMPKDSHPMAMLSMALMSMQRESKFAKAYESGIKKEDYWKTTLEDSLDIVARMPAIAAAIYRIRFEKGEIITPKPDASLTDDFVQMCGIASEGDEFSEMMRLFLVCHCDHEAGNVSAMTTIVVNSALSDLYYSLSAGFNGLAGPLHGLANQEALHWILDLVEKFGGKIPTHEQIEEDVVETLKAGKVVPGYGHAVLRVVDPRFTAFMEFGKKHFPGDTVFKTVSNIFDVVPEVLKKNEKIKNPWPNVDAVTGSLLYHYGLKEFSYYTVLFALSRALGLAAQAVVNRALMMPIFRPKSTTTEGLTKMLGS